jgi:hypothetical protein
VVATPRHLKARILVAPALVLAWLAGAGVAPAPAHEGIPGLTNVLDAVEPSLPAVSIQVVASVADQLVVANPTATPLVVLADSGEPFLQIDGSGVEANESSPSWYQSNDPTGTEPVPPDAAPDRPPRWVRISSDASWGWFDHRLHAVAVAAPPPAKRGVAVRLADWVIPMRYGGESVRVVGHRQYRIPAGFLTARVADSHPIPGLRVGVLGGSVPALFLSDDGDVTVTMIGQAGEPLARFGPSGAEVNEASPTWRLTAESYGQAPDGLVGPAVTPRWRRIDTVARLSWLEPRARYGPGEPPQSIQRRSGPTVVVRWRLPLVVGAGTRVQIAGETLWMPTQSLRRAATGVPWPVGLAAALALALVAGSAGLAARRSWPAGRSWLPVSRRL